MNQGELHDSGERQAFQTGMVRDSGEKPQPHLLSPIALMRMGVIMQKGAKKYDERNWEKGCPISRCVASAMRHTLQFMEGDTSEDHAAQAAVNWTFVMHFQEMIERGLLPADLNDMPDYTAPLAIDLTGPTVVLRGLDPAALVTNTGSLRNVPDGSVVRVTSAVPHPFLHSGPPAFKPRTVYISGPMRGRPKLNFPAFDEAKAVLQSQGWDVLSPADSDREHGLDAETDPSLEHRDWTPAEVQEFIDRDIALLRGLDPETDAIAVLPEWESSTGAMAEVMYARWRGLQVIDALTGDRLCLKVERYVSHSGGTSKPYALAHTVKED